MVLLCCEYDTKEGGNTLKKEKNVTVKLNVKAFEENQRIYKLTEVSKCAEKMEMSQSQLWKVKMGIHNPGKNFIAGALKAFPSASFDELFFLSGVLRERSKVRKSKAASGDERLFPNRESFLSY